MPEDDSTGNVLSPREIVIPTREEGLLGKAGTLFLSGAKLWFNPTDGGAAEVVTSA